MAPGPEHIALVPETKNRMTRCAVTLGESGRAAGWKVRGSNGYDKRREIRGIVCAANVDACTILKNRRGGVP